MTKLLHLLDTIRQQWYNLMLIMGFNQDFMSHEQCEFNYNQFYSMFMCSNTADFLWYLFFNEKVGISNLNSSINIETKQIIKDLKKINLNEINFYHCYLEAYGENYDIIFPQHAWIILQIGDKFYILQSYFCAYTINGSYGFIEIKNKDNYFKMLDFICNLYININSEKEYSRDKLEFYKKKFMTYTGIDTDRWGGDSDYAPNDYKFRIIKHNVENTTNFINNVNAKICNNMAKLYVNKTITNEYDLTFYTSYINKILTVDDLENEESFLKQLEKLTGFSNQDLKLITMKHLEKLTYITQRKSKELMSVRMKIEISYNIKKIICSDIQKAFKCNFDMCE